MEKYNQIQYVIGKDDLKEIINEIIDERFAEKKEDELISTKKVMEMLGVTDATLWRWDKTGILKKVRIGNRVYYRRSDIVRIADGQWCFYFQGGWWGLMVVGQSEASAERLDLYFGVVVGGDGGVDER